MIVFAEGLGLWGLPLAIVGSAVWVGTPYLFVSLGECITEKSGRVNLGLEGTLVMGAMSAYAFSFLLGPIGLGWWLPEDTVASLNRALPLASISPWIGVLVAGLIGSLLGVMHALLCNLPKVNSVAVGIAMMIFFAYGLAPFFGKAFLQPAAPQLPPMELGNWSDIDEIRRALKISPLFLVGVALAPFLAWMFKNTRWGLTLRVAGESEEAAAAMGYSVKWTRVAATAAGGFLAGIGGSFLSLASPGLWSESISSGQGLMAIALVIFARWNPIYCLFAALLFGGVGTISVVLPRYDLSNSATGHLWNTLPYVLTLGIMILTSSRARAMAGAPAELTRVR